MATPDRIRLRQSAGKLLIHAPCHGSYLARIRTLVADLARKIGFSDEDVAKIEMAVDEACSNVLKHAYAVRKEWHWKHRDPEIRLDVRTQRNRLVIEINDHGQRFDFAAYQPGNVEERVRQMETGGYGIAIMRQFMDEVEYSSSRAAGNTLRLVKYLKKT
jgi:serine/threonine-protein kinase RsbW